MKYCDACRTPYPADYSTCPKDQTALRLVSELAVGTVLRGKYEILGQIGAGGMGAVYKARHVVFGELRAIKFLGTHLAEQDDYLERFRTEAVVARKLQHPNAVRIDDFDTAEDGRPFIVMEYVEGQSLRRLLRQHGALPIPRAADIARQALAALGSAHALGIVHRDIKPDNIVLLEQKDGSDLVKILDFGLAKIREGFEGSGGQVATRTGMVMGTPEYMSPEQAMGSKADQLDGRADLYALGIVLYEMVTGRVPFSSDTPIKTILQHVQDDPVPPRQLRPDVSPAMSALLMRALQKDRGGRFPSAEAMRTALSAAALAPGSALTAPRAMDSGEVPTRVVGRTAPAPSGLATGPVAPRARPPARSTTPRTVETPEAASASPMLRWVAAVVVIAALGFAVMRRAPAAGPVESPSPATDAAPTVAPAGPSFSGPAAPADGALQAEIERLFFGSAALRDARISVQVLNGIATLSGEAPSTTAADVAASLARSVAGVQRVFSTIHVPSPATPPPAPAASEAPPTDHLPPPPDDAVEQLLRKAKRSLDEGDPRAAEETFEAVIRMDPGNPKANDALRRLREDRDRREHGGGPPPR